MADSIAEFARKVREALGLGEAKKKEARTPEYTSPRTLEIAHSKPPTQYNFAAIDPAHSPEERIVSSEAKHTETAPYKQSSSKTPDKHSTVHGWAAVDEVPRQTKVGPVPTEYMHGNGIVEEPPPPQPRAGMQGVAKTGSDIAAPGEYMGRAGEAIANRIKSATGIRERTPEEKAANSRFIPSNEDEAIAKRTANIPGREKLQAMADYLARKRAGIPEPPKEGSYEWEVEQSKKRTAESDLKIEAIRKKMAEDAAKAK